VSRSPLAGVRKPFRALACTFVPEAVDLSAAQWEEGEALIERLLSTRPAAVRLQVVWLVRALDGLALLRRGRRLSSIPLEARARLLESLQRSRLVLLRRGIWGLRTLAFLAYYGRPAGRAAVGYGASPGGWAAREARRAGRTERLP